MIELECINKTFDKTVALSDISLSVKEGSFTSLLGPSGCGKSTTLRIIAGLEQPTSGVVRIDGHDVTKLTAAERNIALVFQSYALYPHMTVRQNIGLPLSMRNLTRLQRLPLIHRVLPSAQSIAKENARKVIEIGEMLEIGELMDRKPSELSGGQMQRVAVGRALVRDPAAFLLDEPLSNLDTKLRAQMRTEIVDLHKRTGRTFVYVTHDQSEAMSMSDRIAVFMEGRIVQMGKPQKIFNMPKTISVAAFVGDRPINLVNLKLEGRILPPPFQKFLIHGERFPTQITIGIRPETLEIDSNGPLTGEVKRLEYFGSEALVYVQLVNDVRLRMAISSNPNMPLPGENIRLKVKSKSIHVFDSALGTRIDAQVHPYINAQKPKIAEEM